VSFRPWSLSQADAPMSARSGAEDERGDGLNLMSEIEVADGGDFAEMYKDWQGGAKDWHLEGFEFAVESAKETQDLVQYMENPLIMGEDGDLQNSLVMQAITACCGSPDEIEGVHGFIVEVLHEAEEWAPVCKAVFGVIGACLVASGRGMANDVERKLFYERMVSLGRTLMQVRDTFAHNPPPQMDGLLMTLKTALNWIETFDGRGWFMKALKSSSDKEALQNFNHAITAHCTDMSLSLQATAHRDEHMVLREMAGALMNEIHDIKRVAKQQLTACAQPVRVIQSARCDEGSGGGRDEVLAVGIAAAADERTALLERRLEAMSLQQAEQTRLLQRMLQQQSPQHPPDPAVAPPAPRTACMRGEESAGVREVQGREDELGRVGAGRVSGTSTSPGLKPRSLNRSSWPRSRINDGESSGEVMGADEAGAVPLSCGLAPATFPPLPPPPVAAQISPPLLSLNPGPPPPPLGAPHSPGAATHANPGSPPEELFSK